MFPCVWEWNWTWEWWLLFVARERPISTQLECAGSWWSKDSGFALKWASQSPENQWQDRTLWKGSKGQPFVDAFLHLHRNPTPVIQALGSLRHPVLHSYICLKSANTIKVHSSGVLGSDRNLPLCTYVYAHTREHKCTHMEKSQYMAIWNWSPPPGRGWEGLTQAPNPTLSLVPAAFPSAFLQRSPGCSVRFWLQFIECSRPKNTVVALGFCHRLCRSWWGAVSSVCLHNPVNFNPKEYFPDKE